MARPTLITNEVVQAEALRYLEEVGLADFSLRTLATRLGISSPTLQWRIGTREEFLVGLVNVVAEGIDLPPQGDRDPFDWLRDTALVLKDHFKARPNLVALVRDFEPAAPAFLELECQIAVALLRSGLRGLALRSAGTVYVDYVFGHVYRQEATRSASVWSTPELQEVVESRLQGYAERFPDLMQALREPVPHAGPFDEDEVFRHGLDSVLAGLRA